MKLVKLWPKPGDGLVFAAGLEGGIPTDMLCIYLHGKFCRTHLVLMESRAARPLPLWISASDQGRQGESSYLCTTQRNNGNICIDVLLVATGVPNSQPVNRRLTLARTVALSHNTSRTI